jgi:hypothetical protein
LRGQSAVLVEPIQNPNTQLMEWRRDAMGRGTI